MFGQSSIGMVICIVQTEKTELEGACRAKDELLAVREAENEQIPLLRKELEELQVRKRMLLNCILVMSFNRLWAGNLSRNTNTLWDEVQCTQFNHFDSLYKSCVKLLSVREEWYGGGVSREG